MLVSAWQALPASDARRARLAEPIAALNSWDKRWGIASVPNTLAQFWGDELAKLVTSRKWNDHENAFRHMEALTPAEKLDAFTRGLEANGVTRTEKGRSGPSTVVAGREPPATGP